MNEFVKIIKIIFLTPSFSRVQNWTLRCHWRKKIRHYLSSSYLHFCIHNLKKLKMSKYLHENLRELIFRMFNWIYLTRESSYSVKLSLIKTARHENFPSILGRLIPVAQHHSCWQICITSKLWEHIYCENFPSILGPLIHVAHHHSCWHIHSLLKITKNLKWKIANRWYHI